MYGRQMDSEAKKRTSEGGECGQVVDMQQSVELRRVGVSIDQMYHILQRSARKT